MAARAAIPGAGFPGGPEPVRLSGLNTGLSALEGVAVDAVGHIFVVNFRGNSATVFASTVPGNAASSRTISGGNTNLVGLRVFLRR